MKQAFNSILVFVLSNANKGSLHHPAFMESERFVCPFSISNKSLNDHRPSSKVSGASGEKDMRRGGMCGNNKSPWQVPIGNLFKKEIVKRDVIHHETQNRLFSSRIRSRVVARATLNPWASYLPIQAIEHTSLKSIWSGSGNSRPSFSRPLYPSFGFAECSSRK